MQTHLRRATPLLVLAGLAGATLPVLASSHREAPRITETPKVDGTDFYMFRSYEPGRSGFVTLVADYVPLQDPYGGPNYFSLDPEALYEIHVDNNGDAREDVTFQFRFQNLVQDIALAIGPPGQEKNVSVPLINVGPIAAGSTGALNVVEQYTLNVIFGDRRTGLVRSITNAATGAKTFQKPVDNIGQKSIPDYETYAAAHVYDIRLPGNHLGRMFVGQRKDPFVVNLGETFDLVNTNPLGPVDAEGDDLADANVTSLILEVPIPFLVEAEPVIGGWTSASLPAPQGLALVDAVPEAAAQGFVQVSRLGSPLVNEVVIGLKDKDRFNAGEPQRDARFLDYVTNPTVPALLEVLFGVRAPTQFPRTDLVAVFLTGVGGLNQPSQVVPGEMLRLNTAIAPVPKGLQDELGVIAGDNAGYPNGRRPGDDVVDITLRAAMGVLLPTPVAPDGQLTYTDGAFVNDGFFRSSFPYLLTPLPGSPNGTP